MEPPDLEGLQKPVKRRRKGVVKPPVYEELQLPQRHAVLVGSGGQKTEDGLFANASRGEKVAPNGEKEVNKDQTTE